MKRTQICAHNLHNFRLSYSQAQYGHKVKRFESSLMWQWTDLISFSEEKEQVFLSDKNSKENVD
mgnify:CR=1 FL=1